MMDKAKLAGLRKRYLARLAPKQVSPSARQFFVGVLTDEDMIALGLDPADRAAIEAQVMEGCLKDALLVRDLVLERGKEAVQPMGMVTEAGLQWVKSNSGEGA